VTCLQILLWMCICPLGSRSSPVIFLWPHKESGSYSQTSAPNIIWQVLYSISGAEGGSGRQSVPKVLDSTLNYLLEGEHMFQFRRYLNVQTGVNGITMKGERRFAKYRIFTTLHLDGHMSSTFEFRNVSSWVRRAGESN
jgi:hypothetical protein